MARERSTRRHWTYRAKTSCVGMEFLETVLRKFGVYSVVKRSAEDFKNCVGRIGGVRAVMQVDCVEFRK